MIFQIDIGHKGSSRYSPMYVIKSFGDIYNEKGELSSNMWRNLFDYCENDLGFNGVEWEEIKDDCLYYQEVDDNLKLLLKELGIEIDSYDDA